MQPLPIPERVWEDISIDFITGLPRSRGFEAILVVVDHLTKYCHFVPLKHPYTAKALAEIFVRGVVRLHGVPNSVVSDRDPLFMSLLWKEFFKMQGTKLKIGTAYHPQMNGQTKVTNRCLEMYLRCFITDQPKTWLIWMPWAEFWFNTTYHGSTRMTPFEAVYGRQPLKLGLVVQGEVRVEVVQQDLIERDEALRQLKSHLLRAHDRMRAQANKHRKERYFVVGDFIFLKLKQNRQHFVMNRVNPKLSAKYYGPFEVVEKIGEVAYRLKLPPSLKIHPVFHVSLLKKKVMGKYKVEEVLPIRLEDDRTKLMTPEAILAARNSTKRGETKKQVLRHWKGQAMDEATWEDEVTIRSQFPKFGLEDKALFQEKGIDTDPNATGPRESLIQEEKGKNRWSRVYVRKRPRNDDVAH